MIVSLHKYLIYGNRGEMDRFFDLAQRAGFLEFIGLSNKKALELPEGVKKIIAAIKIARHHSAPSHDPSFPLPDPEIFAEKILALQAEYEKVQEEKRVITAEIARIAIFGDFSRPELDQLERESKRVFQFFCMKSDLARELSLSSDLIYVGTDYDLDYFVSVNKERKQYPKMIEILIDQSVGELRKRLSEAQLESADIERQLHDSAKGLPHLQKGLIDHLNVYHLKLAKHDAALPLGDSLFAVEAWVPETKIKALFGLLSGFDIESEEIAIESRDSIPTYMENKGIPRLGEDLVHVYDTPSPTDKDPSLWVLTFFFLFFSMIISDAGYGLIYLLLGLFLKWKFPRITGAGKRFIKLIMIAGTCCMVWGVLTASFFGIQIGPDNPFRKTSFLHYLATQKAEYHIEQKDDVYELYVKQFPQVASAQDGHDFLVKGSRIEEGRVHYVILEEFYDNLLLEFSLFVGVIHIALSFLRYIRRNPAGIGWIIFIVGGYLYFPSMLNATSIVNFMGWVPKSIAYPLGKQMVYGGLIAVFIIALLQKRKWGALHEITNAIQIFSDVLSYLRLYALALAGMVMAETFNEMGLKLGLVGGFVVILLGHGVNMTLSVMAGVIHGLRLNFLEWYHYSFEGGGRLFNPLRLRKVK
jgi:V/A-type H+-transporting ATPase subunit I